MSGGTRIPAAVSAIAGLLETYQAPRQTVGADCRLCYDILKWDKTHPDGKTDNTVVGTVEVARVSGDKDVEYWIVEKRLGGAQEVYEATITTARTGAFGASIVTWHLDWHQAERPDDLFHLSGVVEGENVVVDGLGGQKQFAATGPVLCPWMIPFVLSQAKASGTFTSVDELTYCKPGQLLHGPEPVSVHIDRADQNPWMAFRHTGPATLPIHYVFDSKGRPVFVTFTMLAWVLRSID